MDLLRSIFKGDKVIWIIFLFLCLISIVEVFSAASTLTYKSGDHWGPITQHSIILMVGAVVVVFMHNIPYKWFQVFPVFLLPLSVVLLGLVMMMERINGAARWMTFMGIQFQPSEVAKMAVIIVTAFILSKGQDEDGASPKAFKRIMIITGVVCLLIAPENLSTAALLFGVVFLMMFIGRVAIKKLLILAGALAGVAIIGVAFLVLTKNSDLPFLHRFDTWRARIEKFHGVERLAHIAAAALSHQRRYLRFPRQGQGRPGLHGLQGPEHRRADLLRRDGFELKHTAAGEQRVVHIEKRIFRGGGDQGQRPVLHKFQQALLLLLVEILDLIQIQQDAAGGQ